jgi:hypothetical protein
VTKNKAASVFLITTVFNNLSRSKIRSTTLKNTSKKTLFPRQKVLAGFVLLLTKPNNRKTFLNMKSLNYIENHYLLKSDPNKL